VNDFNNLHNPIFEFLAMRPGLSGLTRCQGGVAAPSRNGPVPKRRGRGGRSRVTFRNAFLKHLRVSDHPVCGASVASRPFIEAAATPPHEEGNAPALNNSRIRSQVHGPPLQNAIEWS